VTPDQAAALASLREVPERLVADKAEAAPTTGYAMRLCCIFAFTRYLGASVVALGVDTGSFLRCCGWA
jgi:hypothetical protein